MNFVGLTTTQLLAAAAACTALTVSLYLLKLRRRTVEVPFSPLWQSVLSEAQTTRLLSRLQHLWSLLLSLLLGAAVVVAIADPRFDDADEVSHTVVLIDCSPSMGATDVSPSRLAVGVRRVRELIEHRRPSERFLIARMADVTTPLTPMTDAGDALAGALQQLEPGHTEADLPRALEFARDMLESRSRGRVVLVSDGSVVWPATASAEGALPRGVEVEHLTVGKASGNVAITAFAVRRYPLDRSRSELLLELHNTAPGKAKVELSLAADGRTIAVEPVELGGSQRLRRIYDNISSANQRLEARIRVVDGAPDPLAIDDRAYATVPPRRRARVLAITEGNLYLQAALLLDEYVHVDVVSPAKFSGGSEYDALIFDGVLPPTPAAKPAIYLHPDTSAGGVGPLEVEGRIDNPYFDRLPRDEPLLRWTALRDVNVASALRVRTAAGDHVVAASEGGPLIVRGERNGQPFVALTFDIRQSDLPLRAAWPLLLLNILESFQPGDAASQPSGRVGERLSVAVAPGVQARITDPAGEELPVAFESGALGFLPTAPGFHTLHRGDEQVSLAINLPDNLITDIAPAAPLQPSATSRADEARVHPGIALPPWVLLILAATLVLAIEWWTYHRRWTV